MKFLVDMPLSPGLARWLTQEGHNAVHAFSLGLDRAPDSVDYKIRFGSRENLKALALRADSLSRIEIRKEAPRCLM